MIEELPVEYVAPQDLKEVAEHGGRLPFPSYLSVLLFVHVLLLTAVNSA